MLLLGIVLAFDLYFCRMMSIRELYIGSFPIYFVAALFVYAMLFLWIYQYLQKFFNTTKNLFRQFHSDVHPPSSVYHTDDGDHCGTCIAWNLCCTGLSIHDPVLHHARIRHRGIYQLRFFVKLFDNYIPEDAGKIPRKRRRKSHRHQRILQPAPDRTAGGGRKGERGRNTNLETTKRSTRTFLSYVWQQKTCDR